MDVQDYLRLPYHIGMIRSETADGDAGWVSWVEELEGCISQGDTPAEAAAMIYEAMELWIETVLEGGGAVPFPRPEPATQRPLFQVYVSSRPSSGSRRAPDTSARGSESNDLSGTRGGVSLNQYVSNSLANFAGIEEAIEGVRLRGRS